MKKLLLGLLIAVVLLIAVAWVVGSRAPLDHLATVRTVFAAEPDAVWAKVADLGTWHEWNSAVDSMERTADVGGKPAWTLHGGFGDMPMVVEESGPRSMLTRIPADAGIGFHGTWRYSVEPIEGGGCALVMTEAGTIPSPFFRFLSITLFDHHDTLMSFAIELGAHLNEEVEPAAVD